MIKISLRHTEDEYETLIEGHAGYAPIGHDIVCSAVSTLTYAVANWLCKQYNKGEIYAFRFVSTDNEQVILSFASRENEAVTAVWEMFADALEQLASQYNQYIFIK